MTSQTVNKHDLRFHGSPLYSDLRSTLAAWNIPSISALTVTVVQLPCRLDELCDLRDSGIRLAEIELHVLFAL